MFKKMMSLTIIALVLSVISPAAHSAEISIPITGPDGHLYDGNLYLPNATIPVPIVVMIPGTDGVDQRHSFYRARLLPLGTEHTAIDIIATTRRQCVDRKLFYSILRLVQRRYTDELLNSGEGAFDG